MRCLLSYPERLARLADGDDLAGEGVDPAFQAPALGGDQAGALTALASKATPSYAETRATTTAVTAGGRV